MENTIENTKNSMLEGKLWDKIILFALPVALTAILEQLFNASDIAIVGNFTGELKTVAVAAVGANTPIVGLIVNFFVGLALGSNVVIANAIGKKDFETVTKAVHTAVLLSVIGGIVIAAIGEAVAVAALKKLNVPDDVLPYAADYLRIYLLGLPVILLYNFEAAIFRSVGETKMPLIALAAAGVINVVLNLFFVIVLKLNVKGVAIATVISNAISSIFLFVKLLKTDKCIKLHPKKIRIYSDSFASIMKIGLPSGVQSAVFSIANIVIQSAINGLGAAVMAGSSAAFNIEIIAYYVFNSFSQACTTFVGQNAGAKQYDRCKKVFRICVVEDLIFTGVSIGIIMLFGKPLLSLFDSTPEVVAIGYVRLVYIFASYGFSMLYEVTAGYMRGYGISLVPAILTIIGICVTRILWINLVFPQYNTFKCIMTVYPISLGITAVLMFGALLCYRPANRFSKEDAPEKAA